MGDPIEIIKDKLFWVADSRPPQNIENAYFFNIDDVSNFAFNLLQDLTYSPFNKDFGPLNLSMVHRYCRELAKLLNGNQFQGPTRIYHYTCSNSKAKMTNACFLMCAFMVVILKLDAEHSFSLFKHYQSHLLNYRDASKGECYYELTIVHCLQGLQEALKHGWYNFRTFNVKEYEHYEKVENGDLNWIIPGKFLAFMGPVD